MDGKWLQRPKSATSVIFVHGLFSDAENCWRHQNGTYWPSVLQADEIGESLGIYNFTYRTSKTSRSYQIGDATDALREYMEIDAVTSSKNLIFVCHSMGGIVSRRYLVQQQARLIEEKHNIGLFLLASPSLGSRYANWLLPIIYGFKHAQAAKLVFSEDKGWLNELDADFKDLRESGRLPIFGKELIEDAGIFFRGMFGRRVVERFSGARYFANAFKVPGSDHFSISKISNADDIQHRQLRTFIRDMLSRLPNASEAVAESGDASPTAGLSIGAELRGHGSLGDGMTGKAGAAETQQANTPGSLHAVPVLAPPPPSNFVDRPEITAELKAIFCNKDEQSALVVSALQGLGGIGKTALAAHLAHDPEVRRRFPDGVLWATLGQTPDIQHCLNRWIQALGDFGFKSNDAQAASSHLQSLLYNKSMLLVVDDAWCPEDALPFLVGGPGSRVMLTTRIRDIADSIGAKLYELELLTEEQALKLVEQRSGHPIGPEDGPVARKLAHSVGYLPLALELVAAQLARGVSWAEMVEALEHEIARLEALESPRRRRSGEHRLEACFNLSLDRLRAQDEAAWRSFVLLGSFPEDTMVTAAMLSHAFALDHGVAEDILGLLYDDALIMRSQASSPTRATRTEQSYRLHDLLYDIARRTIITPPAAGLGLSLRQCNETIVRNYERLCVQAQWASLPDDTYIHRHLFWHLRNAGLEEEMHNLLAQELGTKNGWYVANEQIGQTSGFQEDVEIAGRFSLSGGYVPEHILRVIQYSLCRSSVNSIAANSPPELMQARVSQGSWTPLQALAYARLIPGIERRLECFSYLMPLQEPEVAEEIFNILYSELRARVREKSEAVIAVLARDFPPEVSERIYDKVFDSDRFFGIARLRAEAMAALAPYFPEERVAKSLAELMSTHTSISRIVGLSGIIPYLPRADAAVAEDTIRRDAEQMPQIASWARLYSKVCLCPLDLPGVAPEEARQTIDKLISEVGTSSNPKQMLARLLPLADAPAVMSILGKYGDPDETFVRKLADRMIEFGEAEARDLFEALDVPYQKAIVAAKIAIALPDQVKKQEWIDRAAQHASTISDLEYIEQNRYLADLFAGKRTSLPHINSEHFIRDPIFLLSYLATIAFVEQPDAEPDARILHLQVLEGTGERILRRKSRGQPSQAESEEPWPELPELLQSGPVHYFDSFDMMDHHRRGKGGPSIASQEGLRRLDALAAKYTWINIRDSKKPIQSKSLGTYARLYIAAKAYSCAADKTQGWQEWLQWLGRQQPYDAPRIDGGVLSCMALQELPFSTQDFFLIGEKLRPTEIGALACAAGQEASGPKTSLDGLRKLFAASGHLDRVGVLHELFFLQAVLQKDSSSSLHSGVRAALDTVERWWP